MSRVKCRHWYRDTIVNLSENHYYCKSILYEKISMADEFLPLQGTLYTIRDSSTSCRDTPFAVRSGRNER